LNEAKLRRRVRLKTERPGILKMLSKKLKKFTIIQKTFSTERPEV